jgi:hypothetical protein
MTWATYDINDDDENYAYHIVPIDDDEMHELKRTCSCRPRAKAVDDMSTLIIHNSFDGREGYELAMQLLTPPED